MGENYMRRPERFVLVSLVFALALCVGGGALAQEAAKPAAKPESADCRGCHEEKLTLMDKTYHAGLEKGCYACHTGAEDHLKGQMDGKGTAGPSLGKLKAKEANAVCLSCHETEHNPTWMGSAHQRRGIKCTDCHGVHSFKSERNQLKAATDPETCYGCHQNIRAQTLRTSHHPIREGLMTCASCHNPHDGSKPKMVKAEWTTELCLQCHTEKRGPFFWEHAPVRENCSHCHTPHGSNHDKLLVSQQPWLCQRCHLNTRHPGTYYSGINAAGELLTASNRAVEHACKNCHQNVHGGNAPTAPYLGR
jgi:DmsE family decaheme c-type cytochrome